MNKISEPEYVSMDKRSREGFLSQIGSFMSGEHVIFQSLCDIWQPRIPYSNAMKVVNSISMSGLNDFQLLMDKLRARGVGLIRTKIEGRSQTPDYVVLTNEWSTDFFHEFLGEWLLGIQMYASQKLPTHSALQQVNIAIPQQDVQSVSYQQAIELLKQRKEEDEDYEIIKLPLPNSDFLYTATDQFFLLLNIIVLKFRYEFRDADTLAKLARSTGRSLIEIKKQLQSKNTSFWTWIIDYICSNTKSWAEHKELIQSSFFLKHYLEARQKSQKNQAKQKEQQEEHYRLILEALCNAEEQMVPIATLESMLHNYKDVYDTAFTGFREEFIKRFIKPITSEHLPFLIGFNENILHKDNACKFFLTRFYALAGLLKRTAIKSMQERLISGKSNNFKSPNHFEQYIKGEVHTHDLFVYALLERPVLLGEIIAHHFQHMRKSQPKEFEQLLKRFFNIEKMQLRPYVKIFELEIENIFESAFSRLSIITRLIKKINGQFAHMKTEFKWSTLDEDFFSTAPASAEDDTYFSKKNTQKKHLSRIIAGSSTDIPAAEKKSVPHEKKTDLLAPKANKKLDDQQLNDLWSDFRQAIHTKKETSD